MSSAPVAGAAFKRYQQRGGGCAAAANGNTVRAFARFLAWVPGVAGWGFGAVFVSRADGHLPPPFRVSLGARCPVPGTFLACLLSSHGLSCKDALLHCGVGLYKSLFLLLLIGRIGPWLDCGAEVTACRVPAWLGPQELHLNGLMMILVDCW